MKLKRQWFRPGRRLEQIATLGAHPFFTRARRAQGEPSPSAHRPLLARAAENAGALFSLLLSTVLICAIAGLVWSFVQELRRDAIVIEPIDVPRALADKGYTPVVVSERLFDEIRKIQTESSTSRARRRLDSASALADIQVAGSGVSMRSLVRYVRQWSGISESTVAGEITLDRDDVVLRLRERMDGVVTVTEVRGNVDALASLFGDAGRVVVHHVDPYTLGAHLITIESAERKYPLTLAEIAYMLAHPPAADHPWALNLWGNVLSAQKDTDGAIEKYKAALALRPQFPIALDNWAKALWFQGNREEGLAKMEEAARTDPGSPAHAENLGDMYADLSQYTKAEASYARAVALDPANGRPQASLAFVLLEQARYVEALAHARQAIAVSPDDTYAYLSLYWAYWLAERPKEAIAVILGTRGAELRRRRSSSMKAFTALHEGRIRDSLTWFEFELTFFPTDALVWYGKGEALRQLDRPAEALAAYDTSVSFLPHFHESDIGAAQSLEAMGKRPEADARFARSASANPGQPRILREWGRFLERQGRGADAKARYSEADTLLAAANGTHRAH